MRMLLARVLDYLPWTCWADLVAWAYGHGYLADGLRGCDLKQDGCYQAHGVCWCGKRRRGAAEELQVREFPR